MDLLWYIAEALAASMGIIAMLYTFAARLGADMELHKLKIEAHRLRAEYLERIEQLKRIGAEAITTESPPLPQMGGDDRIAA